MGGRAKFAENIRASPFNKDLSNETTFNMISILLKKKHFLMPKMFYMFNGVPYITIRINNITSLLHSIHYLNRFFYCRICRRYPAASVAVQPQPVRGGGEGPAGPPRPGTSSGLRHSSQPSDRLWGLWAGTVLFRFFLYRRPILCTLHIAVVFFVVSYKGLYRGGGGRRASTLI
jgi:hypothetical protein